MFNWNNFVSNSISSARTDGSIISRASLWMELKKEEGEKNHFRSIIIYIKVIYKGRVITEYIFFFLASFVFRFLLRRNLHSRRMWGKYKAEKRHPVYGLQLSQLIVKELRVCTLRRVRFIACHIYPQAVCTLNYPCHTSDGHDIAQRTV